ncbi:rRNA maturation RNase YbeY [Shumkonia mesophila]|uniref:rRNA maturation RNase YbeY n=1 Tax=Shumkonia mesophila TaxID=2838854 RepID=UPI002934C46E|nr:rRNA maturation RNase YbeY [Shumkonia mesophila]
MTPTTTDGPEIDVAAPCPSWIEALPDAEARGRAAALAAFAAARAAGRGAGLPAEASLVLADDALVQGLNRDYRGMDKPTNVLTFANLDGDGPAPGGAPVLLGDIVLAYETTAAEAAAQGKPLADHFSHLVVHGMLHLLGFDHTSAAQAEEMEGLEIRVLKGLGVADPYAEGAEGQ